METPDRGTSESYLVRIYRRDESGIAGLVEIIGKDETGSFRDISELLAIMGIGPPDGEGLSRMDLSASRKEQHRRVNTMRKGR